MTVVPSDATYYSGDFADFLRKLAFQLARESRPFDSSPAELPLSSVGSYQLPPNSKALLDYAATLCMFIERIGYQVGVYPSSMYSNGNSLTSEIQVLKNDLREIHTLKHDLLALQREIEEIKSFKRTLSNLALSIQGSS